MSWPQYEPQYDPYQQQYWQPQQPYPSSPGYPPAGYPAPAYPPAPAHAPGYPGAYPPADPGTNAMAIMALIFAFPLPLLAIVFGHVANAQIRRSGQRGSGMATAGLVIGYLVTVLSLLGGCAYVVIMVLASSVSLS